MSSKLGCRRGVRGAAKFALSFGSVGVAVLASTPANAQQAAVPSREQIEVPKAVMQVAPSQVIVIDRRAPSPCPLAASALQATIEEVKFVGPDGAALPAEVAALLAHVSPLPGAQSVSQVCALRDEAAARLADAGYIAAVSIPPQEIRFDTRQLSLQVTLARLVAITVEGDAGPYAGRIGTIGERLKGRSPLKSSDIERELLVASDAPGLDVRLNLVATGVQGEVEGRLHVTRRPFSVSATATNYGSRAVGRGIGTVRADVYGLTGLADVTFLGVSSTYDFKEQVSVQGGHYFSLANGFTLGGSLAVSNARPSLPNLDLRSHSILGALEGYGVLDRSLTGRTTLGGGLEVITQRSRLHGGGISLPVTRDKLRVAFMRLRSERRLLDSAANERGSISGSLEVRKGLGLFGASERGEVADGYFPSRLEGDPRAMLARGNVAGRLREGNFSFLTMVQGQVAGKPLAAFEEYSAGQYTIGRGYDPAAASGDSALAARIEPSLIARAGGTVLEPYAFADAVRLWNYDGPGTTSHTLKSVGAGLRAYLGGNVRLDAAWAHPFDGALPGAPRASDRFLISIGASFAPGNR